LANEYGKSIQKSGPLVKSATRSGESILVEFTDAEGLNVPDQQAPAQFEVGDERGRFTKVDAKIDGVKIVITWPKEKSASSVRYAWAANPLANLYNAAHLPASPFQVAVTTQK
jgi:sialate O-acetylesterase